MGKIGFKLVGFIVVVGGLFLAGFLAGGAFGSGMAADNLSTCLPAETLADLSPCLGGE